MNLKQALKRIEELERRVRELELRPPVVIHNYPQAQYYPYTASLPEQYAPWRTGEITCGSVGGGPVAITHY